MMPLVIPSITRPIFFSPLEWQSWPRGRNVFIVGSERRGAQKLKGDDYRIVKWSEANGCLENSFFASFLQVELMRCYPDILVMDSTYKTNRYRMPLFYFGGTSPMNSFFARAFCFLVGESETSIPGRLNNSILLSENKIFVYRMLSSLTTGAQ